MTGDHSLGVEVPSEVLAQPEMRRALAHCDWAMILKIVHQETGASQTKIASATGLSQPYISRLLRGRSVEPTIRTIRMLCDGLGIPRSFVGLLDKDQEVDTNRRQFLGGALAVSTLSVVGTADGAVPLEAAEDDRLLMVPSVTYRRLEQRMSPRSLITPAIAHLALVRQLAARRPHARKLHLVLSETAGLAAWLYVDLDDRANARRHYRLAVRAAERSTHPLLPAYMQASLGHFATLAGDGVQGLRQVQEARHRLPRSAPPIAMVWMDAVEAVALASQGDHRAIALLDRAEQRLPAALSEEPVWPWLFKFDAAKLAGYRAVAATRLRRADIASPAFALADAADQGPKQRAMMQLEHARLHATTGDVAKACATAMEALDTGRRYGSERVLHGVAGLRNQIRGRLGREAAELDQQLRATYEEDG